MLNGLGTNLQTSVSMCLHRRGKANITEQPQIGIRVVKSPTGWWIVVVHYCVYKGHGVDSNWIPLGCIPQPLLHTQSNSPNVAFTLFGGSASARHQPCTQSSRNETHLKGFHFLSTSERGWGGQQVSTVGAVTFVFYVKPLRAVGARTVHVVFSRTVSSDTAPRVVAHCACREL